MRAEVVLTLAAVVASALAQHGGPAGPRAYGHHKPMPPPPVPEGSSKCKTQQIHRPHVSCSPDGNYTSVQCCGGPRARCHCVDPLTGIQLVGAHSVPEREKDTLDCSDGNIREHKCLSLTAWTCDKICLNGYSRDKNGCYTCTCKPLEGEERCRTHEELLKEGCPCGCIQLPEGPGCPTCDPQCEAPEENNNCQVSTCAEDQVLLSVGKHGKAQCVDYLSPGDKCGEVREVPGEKGWPGPAGALNRSSLTFLGEGHRPCQRNHICQQSTLKHRTCQPVSQNDPCREQDTAGPRRSHSLQCSDDGGFRPVQCRQHEADLPQRSEMGSTRKCHCVNATNGSPIEGTEVTVGPRDREPNCQYKSYRHCDVPGLHRPQHQQHNHYHHFSVHHGHTYFDTGKCRTCQCHDGDPHAFCTEARDTCTLLVPKDMPKNCSLPNGRILEHRTVMKLDCGVCGCLDGRFRCIHFHYCKPKTTGNETDLCRECERKSPPGPVCGPDGRNHISSCAALHCAGVSPLDIQLGPCQSQDPCVAHPCKDNEVCVRRSGVACVSRKGCQPHHLRMCFEKEELQCLTKNSTAKEEGREVCGSDGQTYPALCDLLQKTTGVKVVHQGKCHAPICNTGPVCGSDGVTYPNVCVMRSQSIARVDYRGECHHSQHSSLDTHCQRVRENYLCQHNSKNCPNLVQPQDGCCPVCGGAVTVALDQDALDEASEQDSELGTVDGFVSRLMEFPLLKKLRGKCQVEATLTDTSNLQLTLSAELSTEAKHCQSTSEDFALSVNDAVKFAGVNEVTFPQVYEFAMAAFAQPAIQEDRDSIFKDYEKGGALQTLPMAVTCIVLLVGAILN